MKKNKIGILLVIALSLITLAFNKQQNKQMNKTYVPDEATAVKIAEAIWLPIYGERIYDQKPFIAKLKDNTTWVVEGTLKTQKGGVAYIEIQKSDCKILKVTHGK